MEIRTVDLPEDLYFPEAIGSCAVTGLLGTTPSCTLATHDLDGNCVWREQFDSPHHLGIVSHSECWVMNRHGVVAFAPDGSRTCAFDLQLQRRERLGAIAHQDEAIYISIYRTKPDPHLGMAPRLVRVTLDGEIVWSTTLPVDRIAYEGCVYAGVASNWETRQSPPWIPESWLPYGPDQLLVSGNRVLASFQEMPRSGIGCRYVLDTVSGRLMWKSRATPIGNSLALADGKFLLGDQGYGAFETHLYEEGVDALRKWDSHGHCVVLSDGRLVCVEMSNDMSVPQYLVELLPDGSVERLSCRLDGYYSSKPIRLVDGIVFFWRADRVWRWSDKDGLRSVSAIGFGAGSYASSLHFSEKRFGLNIRGPWRERGSERSLALIEAAD